MKPGMHINASHQMAMTPQLLQSIRLLQLSSQELELELRQALDGNLMLESEDDAEDEVSAPAEVAAADDDGEQPVSGCDAEAVHKVEADFDWSSADSWSGGEPASDEDDEHWTARCAAPVPADARVQAAAQLELILQGPREALLAEAILEAVDDNGYLEKTLAQIAAGLQGRIEAGAAELEAVLRKVQSVEPSGFAARSLRECLLLQLQALPSSTHGLLDARTIVEDHLESLAAGELASMADMLGIARDELEVAVNLILSLDPKPGASSRAAAEAIVPDLTISGGRGSWKVELNPGHLPRIRVNSLYERTIVAGSHKALRDQLLEARWLVRGLQMRHDTLLKTARAIFERQRGFLESGEVGMVALTLREIAEAIGMHESTVCRVTTAKYVQTPWGTYELKAFFPSQITGCETETSGTAVKAMIRRIIDTEDRRSPHCDGAIAALLLRHGIRVARRTVAKYREAMKIAPAPQRRQAAIPRAAARLIRA